MGAVSVRSTAHPGSTIGRHVGVKLLGELGRALGALGRVVVTLAKEWRLRREIRSVEGFTEAMLEDIGLARSNIEDAVRHGRPNTRPTHYR